MQQQEHSSSENDCYSTNEEYFLDICRFGQFDEIKQFLSTLNKQTSFDWEWTSNSGDNFVRNYLKLTLLDMLSGNNFPDIFVYLINQLKQRGLKQKMPALLNKLNSSGSTPLHYSVITDSKQMLLKLLEQGCDPNIQNQFGRTALDEAQMMQKFQIAEILAPVTKQDIQKLKQQFGQLDVCNEDSDSEQEEQQKQKPTQQKVQEKQQ